jgi:hypothetical protein
VGEDLLEAQAIEEPLVGDIDEIPVDEARPLPARAPAAEVDVWRGEVRSAAIAAAGGLVAGAATVAVVRAVRRPSQSSRSGLLRRNKGRAPSKVVASRSFLVDVHVLGR